MVWLCVAALVGPACSSGSGSDAPSVAADGSGASIDPTSPDTSSDHDESANGSGGKKGSSGSSGGGSGSKSGGSGSTGGSGSSGSNSSNSAPPADGDAPYPITGRYTYSQKGTEEFCQATCQKGTLPPTQTADLIYKSRSSDRAVVVNRAQDSDARVTTTTFKFTPSGVVIKKLESRFTYGGVTFTQTITPKPPIDSLRLPATVGSRWVGSWTGDIAGDYEVEVVRFEDAVVRGRSVEVVVLETRTEFRGDMEGVAELTAWVDLASKVIVKTKGSLDVSTSLGDYRTDFKTNLTGGPGYQ